MSRSEITEPVSTALYASSILALPSLLTPTPFSPHLLVTSQLPTLPPSPPYPLNSSYSNSYWLAFFWMKNTIEAHTQKKRIFFPEHLEQKYNKNSKITAGLPDSLQDFLRKCLMRDERSRWSADQLNEHTFIKVTQASIQYETIRFFHRPFNWPWLQIYMAFI